MSSQLYAQSGASGYQKYIAPGKRSVSTKSVEGAMQDMAQLSIQPSSSLQKDAFQPKGKTGLLWAKSDVSEAHVQGVDKIIKAFPEGLKRHFRKNGCQFMLARTVDEVFPDLKEGSDIKLISGLQQAWQEVRGYCRWKMVAIPEYFLHPKTKEWVAQRETRGGLKGTPHEAMHLLHNTSSLLWDFENEDVNDEFYEAYMKDLQKLSPEQRQKYYYAVQTDDIKKPSMKAMQELFAEIGAALNGGCLNDPEGLKKAFPRVTEYLMQGIKAVAKTALKG